MPSEKIWRTNSLLADGEKRSHRASARVSPRSSAAATPPSPPSAARRQPFNARELGAATVDVACSSALASAPLCNPSVAVDQIELSAQLRHPSSALRSASVALLLSSPLHPAAACRRAVCS
uniref:Uncharacterized protein n=1 Tax=Leersia perrieri TaxID=77586 RepID=A0A0D9V4F3_9ORYZ